MSNNRKEELKKLISSNPKIVEFGSEEDFVGEQWLDKAEKTLALELTESYRWFLKKYSGGEVCGEEIYSIYGMNFEEVFGGDIVYQHIVNKKNNLVNDNELVISETDLGEVFYFDYSDFDGRECSIKLRFPNGKSKYYAKDYYDYLIKRISAYL